VSQKIKKYQKDPGTEMMPDHMEESAEGSSTRTISENEPFLTPIEHPPGLQMRLAYYFTKRQFGKVITSIKVHSARMPPAFGRYYAKVASLDKKLQLPRETVMLIRDYVSRINVCLFCMDGNRWAEIKESMDLSKFDELPQYKTSPRFTTPSGPP
jgi:hypothetical protein